MLNTAIILVGHGSRVAGAENVLPDLAAMLSRAVDLPVDYAYMQFAEPTLPEMVRQAAERPAGEVFLLPVFLTSGQHVTTDIPEMLEPLRERFPDIAIFLGEPLGPDFRLVEVLNERLMALQDKKQSGPDIAAASFRLIEQSTDLPDDPGQREIAKRVVHTTGDTALGRALLFSGNATAAGIEAIRKGSAIVTDVRMVKAGISGDLLLWNNEIVAGLEALGAKSRDSGLTKCAYGIRETLVRHPKAIVAVGNAPTALNEVCRMIDEQLIEPPLVVGVPVGFVGAAESKMSLAKRPIEYITLPGTRGGSPIAAAIINALAKLAGE